MSDMIVDAPLLACPNPTNYNKDDFQDIFKEYLQRLVDVTKVKGNFKSVNFWIDSELPNVLGRENCYPFHHSLKSAFSELYDGLEFQLSDIINLLTSLLSNSHFLDDEGKVEDVVLSDCFIKQDVIANRNEKFTEHICRQVYFALQILGDGKTFNANTFLASTLSKEEISQIELNYKIDAIQYRTDEVVYFDDAPLIDVKLENFLDAPTFIKKTDLIAWWASERDHAALDCCCAGVARLEVEPLARIFDIRSGFCFGDRFLSSAKEHGFMHDPSKIGRLVQACIDLVLGRNLDQGHALRTGKAGNAPQVCRGDWKAWRHDVDYEYHLHYWKNGPHIEFSKVGTHEDFTIF